MAVRKNDVWLGLMSVLMLGLTFATAYFGMQNAKNNQARDAAEKELDTLQKKFDGKTQSYSQLSSTNANLNNELKTLQDKVDSTAIQLQKYQQMSTVAKGRAGKAEDDNELRIALEIAQKDLKDLQRRSRDMELFAEAVRKQLRADNNQDAVAALDNLVNENQQLASVLQNRPDENPGGNTAEKNESAKKDLREPLERVRKDDPKRDDPKRDGPKKDGPGIAMQSDDGDSGAINLKPPRDGGARQIAQADTSEDADTSNDGKRARVIGSPADEKPSLSDDELAREIENEIASEVAAARKIDRLEIINLQATVDDLTETLARREKLLREQARFIEKIKPVKSQVRQAAGAEPVENDGLVRVDRRETTMRELDVNQGFTSGRDTSYRRVVEEDVQYVAPADDTHFDDLDPRGVIIKEEILP